MHPQREELAAYLVGTLPEHQAHSVEGHLQSCPDCDATLNSMASPGDTIVAKLRGGPPADPFAQEAGCQAMVEVIKEIGRDPSVAGGAAAKTKSAAPKELGNLREYKLLKKLGEGGMGAVYKALHTKLDKVVALKVLPADRTRNSEALARFEREMKAVGKLQHPNIVGAHDAGEANGTHFLVMELVDGEDLSNLVKRRGPLAVADACELIRQAAIGLQEAHEHGMVHRDIKPSNLMLTTERRNKETTGVVKILDMGLALLEEPPAAGGGELTGTGQLMGTIDYMSPEQATDTHRVDIRADIYALGATLYKLLTGEVPLDPTRHDTVVKKLIALVNEPRISIRDRRADLPAGVIELVDKMLAKDPANRPATPDEVATALEPFCAGHQIAALLGESKELKAPPLARLAQETVATRPAAGKPANAAPLAIVPAELTVHPEEPRKDKANLKAAGVKPAALSPASRGKRPWQPFAVGLGLLGGGGLLLWAVTVFLFQTPQGTLRVEIKDPKVEVKVVGTKIHLKNAETKDITLDIGEKQLRVTRDDFTFETTKLVLEKNKVVTVTIELLPDKVQAVVEGKVVGEHAVGGPPVAKTEAAKRKFELAFDFNGKVQIPSLKLDQPGPVTIEAAFIQSPSQGVDLFAGFKDGLHLCTFSADRASVRGGPDETSVHVLGSLPTAATRTELALVYTGKEILGFQDGKLLARGDASTYHPDQVKEMFLLCREFVGRLLHVRVSRVARYDADYALVERFTPDKETVALYHCDEGSGDVLTDASGNKHHGQIIGGKWLKSVGTPHWTPTLEQLTFLDAVENLPLKNRIEAVSRKLREVNPILGESPQVEITLEPKEGEPTSCRVEGNVAVNIWPLAALTSLTKVDLMKTCVVDSRPLTRLPLTELQVKLILDNATAEAALKSMSTLTKINGVPAKDYWAQRAEVRQEVDKMAGAAGTLSLEDRQSWVRAVMQRLHPQVPEAAFNAITVGKSEAGLVQFRGYDLHAGVFDFSPVRALAIEDFFLLDGNLFDATPLAKLKLKVCNLHRGNLVRDLSPFAGLPLVELNLAGTYVDLRPLAGMKLKLLRIGGTQQTELSPLKDMPLETLECSGIGNLAPLAGLPLKRLTLGNYAPVSDLSPLKGMPLETLIFDRSKVTDLSPLTGMKLKELVWWGSPVADLNPLKDMPLTKLDVERANLDPVLATLRLVEIKVELRLHSDAEEQVLRGLKLEKINDLTPDEFWKDVEKRRKADLEKIAETAKLPADPKALEKALGEGGQYPKLKFENDELIEASISHSGTTFAPLAAFPKLRKLSLASGGDYSPLLKLTLLEEFECPPQEVAWNRPVLMRLTKLKTINGKPAKEVLGGLATEAK